MNNFSLKVYLKDTIYNSIKKCKVGQAPAAHAYNPSYSGDRDQKDRGSKPAWGNSS
jgi:hypothetical protein